MNFWTVKENSFFWSLQITTPLRTYGLLFLLGSDYLGTQVKENFLNTFCKYVLKLHMQKPLLHWDSERIQNN